MGAFFREGPWKLTGIVSAVSLVLVVGLCTWVAFSDISDRKKKERAVMIGSGVGLAAALVVGPGWILTGLRVGKARREEKAGKR